MIMTKDQLIQIAQNGFSYEAKKLINFDTAEMFVMGGVYRLYKPEDGFNFMLPKTTYFSVFIGIRKFVQIESCGYAFNHRTAIKEMEKLKLI